MSKLSNLEYGELKGWLRTENIKDKLDTNGFVTIAVDIDEKEASLFIRAMKWKYENLIKPGEKFNYPRVNVIENEFKLFSIYRGVIELDANIYKEVDTPKGPIHFSKRKIFDIKVGETYYVCFDGTKVKEYKVAEIMVRETGDKMVRLESKGMDKWIYEDELGRTPEEAINNRVTN